MCLILDEGLVSALGLSAHNQDYSGLLGPEAFSPTSFIGRRPRLRNLGAWWATARFT